MHYKLNNKIYKIALYTALSFIATSATIALTNKLAEVGVNAALVVNPCFYKAKMTEDVLYHHYIEVS